LFGRVLIGYDGSESGRDAVAFGEALAKPMGAELALGRVFAWKPVRDPLREVPHLRGKREEDERKAVQQLQSAASSSSGRPVVVANDDVALGLEELAADLGAGLIVVGSSSRGRPHSALAGNVGQRLLHGSPCPVAVAPQRFRHDTPRTSAPSRSAMTAPASRRRRFRPWASSPACWGRACG
jgi:nucleotide-binding universal stress UspA family protein